jgi:hypothetical protein
MSHRSGVEQCTTIAEKHVITHSLQGVFFWFWGWWLRCATFLSWPPGGKLVTLSVAGGSVDCSDAGGLGTGRDVTN